MKAVNSFCSDGFTSVWAVTAFSNSSQTGNEEGKGTNATLRSDCADTCNCGDSGRSPPRDGSRTSPQSRQARRPSPACGCRPCTYRASSREGSPPASCPDALGWRAPYRRKAPLTGTAILFAPVPCFVPASQDAPSSEPKNKKHTSRNVFSNSYLPSMRTSEGPLGWVPNLAIYTYVISYQYSA